MSEYTQERLQLLENIDKIAELEAKVERLEKDNKRLCEAAEIFRDFGDFQHLYKVYDLAQVIHAREILKQEEKNEK